MDLVIRPGANEALEARARELRGGRLIEGWNITFHCPGAYTIKAASFTFVGHDNVPTRLPLLPTSNYQPNDRYSHTN
ncbi:hypothetical protein PSAC2689_40474 [Paraburkholderia sacchari]|uniref:hypothetical protein n=1 Tax=Paraburkholderia sacchari TaxID=159450 RepID=UPI0039A654A7